MAESVKGYASKGLALLILLFAGYILFKLVVAFVFGTLTAMAWTLAGIAAVVGVIWALTRLL